MTLLAIDGPAGAGKTTLAAQLEKEHAAKGSVRVIHLDDLYSGWTTALGNDLTEVLDRLASAHLAGQPCTVKLFNWISMSFDREEVIQPTDVLILEGVGAAQVIVRDAGATTYWIDVEPHIGLQRVLERDGSVVEPFMKQWQIDQDKHFARDETRENCEFKLTS